MGESPSEIRYLRGKRNGERDDDDDDDGEYSTGDDGPQKERVSNFWEVMRAERNGY